MDVFRCERRNVTLSPAGCARMWEAAKAKRPQPYEGIAACVACPVGARNAGQPQAVTTIACEDLRMVCPRCGCPAPRLINGRFCISCFNRHGEVLSGRNRKGNPPGLTGRLMTARLAVQEGERARVLEMPLVTGLLEVMFHTAKSARGTLAFGTPPVQFQAVRQMELCL
jgi:hypothetical protein